MRMNRLEYCPGSIRQYWYYSFALGAPSLSEGHFRMSSSV